MDDVLIMQIGFVVFGISFVALFLATMSKNVDK